MAIAAGSFSFFMPLRYAAIAISLLEFILSGLFAIALWVEVTKWSLEVGSKITGTSAAAAAYYTILSFSALIGSFATIKRSKEILKYFAFCLGWSLGIQLSVSALQLWGYLSTPRQMLVTQCVIALGMTQETCNRAFALSVGWVIASIVIGLLVQLCSAYVVSSYSSKLSSEDEWTENAPLPTISAPQPAPVSNMITRPHSQVMVQATFEGYGNEKEKEWAASSRDSLDDSSDESNASPQPSPHVLLSRPPSVPILDPAPPKRIVRMASNSGTPVTSPKSSDIGNIENLVAVTSSENPYVGSTMVSPPGLSRPPPAVVVDKRSSKQNSSSTTNPFDADPSKMV